MAGYDTTTRITQPGIYTFGDLNDLVEVDDLPSRYVSVSLGGGNDKFVGGSGRNYVSDGDGDDIVILQGGRDDTAYVGRGNDTFTAVSYGAKISFTKGLEVAGSTDRVHYGIIFDLALRTAQDLGAYGIDTFENFANVDGGEGRDTLYGTNGENTLRGKGGRDILYGRDGNDILQGGEANDYLDGGTGADTMSGASGDDTMIVDNPGDIVYGGHGRDLILSSISLDLDPTSRTILGVDDLTLTGTANLNGFGSDGANLIRGNSGANKIDGRGGDDTIFGGHGEDTLTGGSGNDTLNGDGGQDTLYGGTGVDALYGGSSDDSLHGDTGDDFLDGETGDDRLDGGGGLDHLFGGTGRDELIGGANNDFLDGGSGDDSPYGGAGADELYGGTGADTFVFKSTGDSPLRYSLRDIVLDFIRQQGDRVDLSAIDANTEVAGNQAFKYIGTDEFSGKAGELRYARTALESRIYADVDGDGVSDFVVVFESSIAFKAGDFIL